LLASCHVFNLLAKESKPFSDGDLIIKYLQHIVQDICPETENVFSAVSFSRATITRRDEDISAYLLNQLRHKAKELERLCLALD
jgi:hypothetical protein